jgi:hypothetical protein
VYVAFQANTGSLWYWDSSSGAHDLRLGMMRVKGNSPSISVAGFIVPKIQIAFQANTGHLWEWNSWTGGHDLHLGMMAGTSPAVAARLFGEPEIWFQANTGWIWRYLNGRGTNAGEWLAPHTSPSFVEGPFRPTQAVQAWSGHLWVAHFSGWRDTGLGMMPGTSPSSNPLAGVAFQANTGRLWISHGPHGTEELGRPMMAGTSPSIWGVNNIAYQGNNGHLCIVYLHDHSFHDTGLRMAPGTSPSNDGRIAFQGSNGHLWINERDTGLGMAPGTSPSLVNSLFT